MTAVPLPGAATSGAFLFFDSIDAAGHARFRAPAANVQDAQVRPTAPRYTPCHRAPILRRGAFSFYRFSS